MGTLKKAKENENKESKSHRAIAGYSILQTKLFSQDQTKHRQAVTIFRQAIQTSHKQKQQRHIQPNPGRLVRLNGENGQQISERLERNKSI